MGGNPEQFWRRCALGAFFAFLSLETIAALDGHEEWTIISTLDLVASFVLVWSLWKWYRWRRMRRLAQWASKIWHESATKE